VVISDYNTPVMYLDPSGDSFIAILGTIALSAAIGAVIGGIIAAINGDDILAGMASGAISAVIVTVGVAFALTLGPVAGVLVSAASGFGGGFLSDYVNQGMNNGWDNIDYNHAISVGTVTGVFSLLTFGTMSYITSSTPSVFSGITDTTLAYHSRLNSSLSISPASYYLATTYGAIYTAFNSLLNLGLNEEGEIVIDGYAGCD